MAEAHGRGFISQKGHNIAEPGVDALLQSTSCPLGSAEEYESERGQHKSYGPCHTRAENGEEERRQVQRHTAGSS